MTTTNPDREKQIRQFFRQILAFFVVNFLFVILWLLTGRGYFWPFWTIVLWGIFLLVNAINLRALPSRYQRKAEEAFESVSTLTTSYEDKFVAHVTADDTGAKDTKDAKDPKPSPASAIDAGSVAPKAAVDAKPASKKPKAVVTKKAKASTAPKKASSAKKTAPKGK